MKRSTRILFGPDWLSRRPGFCIVCVLLIISTIDYLMELA